MTRSTTPPTSSPARCGRIPLAREPDLDRGARPPGIADRAAPPGRRRSRRLDRGFVDDDPRRHARRHRRQSRQVQGRRPADPDPRRTRRVGARPRRHVENLRVPTGGGGTTPLAAVADFNIGHGPTAINRYDRSRRVTIEADLHGDAPLGQAVAAIHALPTAKNLPPGVEIQRDRRRRDHERGVPSLRRGDGRGSDDGLRPAGAAVRQLPAADHHSLLAAALHWRLDHRAADHPQGDVDAGRHRHPDADGHRHQERHHAGGFRRRSDRAGTPRWRRWSMPGASGRGPS